MLCMANDGARRSRAEFANGGARRSRAELVKYIFIINLKLVHQHLSMFFFPSGLARFSLGP